MAIKGDDVIGNLILPVVDSVWAITLQVCVGKRYLCSNISGCHVSHETTLDIQIGLANGKHGVERFFLMVIDLFKLYHMFTPCLLDTVGIVNEFFLTTCFDHDTKDA